MLPVNNSMRNGGGGGGDCGGTTTVEGVADDGSSLENGTTGNATANYSSSQDDTDASKQVHYSDSGGQGEDLNNLGSYGGSISSIASHESELPLKLSMV